MLPVGVFHAAAHGVPDAFHGVASGPDLRAGHCRETLHVAVPGEQLVAESARCVLVPAGADSRVLAGVAVQIAAVQMLAYSLAHLLAHSHFAAIPAAAMDAPVPALQVVAR
jgi:hypothetical protein